MPNSIASWSDAAAVSHHIDGTIYDDGTAEIIEYKWDYRSEHQSPWRPGVVREFTYPLDIPFYKTRHVGDLLGIKPCELCHEPVADGENGFHQHDDEGKLRVMHYDCPNTYTGLEA